MKVFYALFLLIAAMFGMAMADQTYTYYVPASQNKQQKKHGHGHQGIISKGIDKGKDVAQKGKNKFDSVVH